MANRIRQKRPTFSTSATVLAMAVVTIAATVSGCLPASRQSTTAAPVVQTDNPDAETAYWRNEYRKNRVVPPTEYAVMPKPMPNNQFGEFEDDMYRGLDTQPELPPLPDAPAILPAATRQTTYPAPPPEYAAMRRQGGTGGYPVLSPAAAGSAVMASSAPRPAGIQTDAHFYPVEQLVYGGDYPDIDRPESYRLMPKDVIGVTVKDHPEFSGKLEIQPDGTVRIPNSPDLIRVRGQSVDEAAETIRRTLAAYVKGECIVRVQANRARGGYYFVFGDVLQPGRFPMGLEPIKLSDAVLAANWEANPARLDADGDELGPAFPAANPRGKFIAPRSADMARVMLITPHRSQPARTVHDVRSAMLGMTANDPVVRPGQIIVVPSLDPGRNLSLGLDLPDPAMPPEARMPGHGFSGANTPARLPEVAPPTSPYLHREAIPVPAVEANMANAFEVQANTEASRMEEGMDEYCETDITTVSYEPVTSTVISAGEVPSGRRLGRKLPQKRQFSREIRASDNLDTWSKGF